MVDNKSKTTNKVAISQYKELDETAKCFATAMLQLIAVTFQSLYQIQCIKENALSITGEGKD